MRADVLRQRVCGNVIRLNERGIEKIAQRDPVAGLKSDIILKVSDESLLRNRRNLIEVTAFVLCPVKHHARGRDFC